MTKRAPAKRPPIHMIDSEADTLTDLALARQDQSPALAELLLQEIDRAKIYTAAKIPADIVTLHNRVEFVDEGNGQSRQDGIVSPVYAYIPAGRHTRMTPLGDGLIGPPRCTTHPQPDNPEPPRHTA